MMPAAEVTIREATALDAAVVAAVIRAAFAGYDGRLDPPSSAHRETEESIRIKLATGGAILAVEAGAVVGCLLYEAGPERLYFSRLAVLPDWRGLGIGRRLIEAVEAKARELRCPRVRLGVRLALPAMVASNRRRGYEPVEYHSHPGRNEPTYVLMEKPALGGEES